MFSASGDLGFLIILFALSGFLICVNNILNYILLCEVIWIGLYFICVIYGSWADSLLLCVWAIIFLCLATSESVIGLSLILFKNNIDENLKNFNTENRKKQVRGKNYSQF